MASNLTVKKKILSLLNFDEVTFSHTRSTHDVYIGAALSFIKRHILEDGEFHPLFLSDRKYLQYFLARWHRLIVDFLSKDESYARHLTSDSWRQRRISIEHLYACAGLTKEAAAIAAVVNPSSPNKRAKRPDGRKRKILVEQDKFRLLLKDRLAAGDDDSWSILVVMDALGVRPCELAGITIRAINRDKNNIIVEVKGSKNTYVGTHSEKNRRGIDRVLQVKYSAGLVRAIEHCNGVAANVDNFKGWLNSARGRVFRAAQKIFPGDKRRFCFYTLRHQVGSLVKNIYKDAPDGCRKVAAILGHKCTKSSARYGNGRVGKSLRTLKSVITPHTDTVNKVVDNRSKLIRLKTQRAVNEHAFVAEVTAALSASHPADVLEEKVAEAKKKYSGPWSSGYGDKGPGFK